jgi:hypothetical protein
VDGDQASAPQSLMVADLHGAHRGRDDLEVRVRRRAAFDHRGELVHLQLGEVLVDALDLEPEAAVKSSSLPIITSTCRRSPC